MFLRQLSHSFPSFHLAIHIIAHLFNLERYSRSRQATDGSLASILSNLPHQEHYSWLNPIQSPNTVSWFKGKASGIWVGRSWCPWWTLCLAEISPFIDSGVCDIHQYCWSHWSDHHSGSGSHGDFSYGIYPEELFWGLLVYTPHFYHLLHWLRNSWSWVRSSNSHFSCPSSWSCTILCHILSIFSASVELSGSRQKRAWLRIILTSVQSFLRSGMILPPTASLPNLKGSLLRYNQDKDSRLLLGDVIVIVVIITLLIIIISSAWCWLLWRTYAVGYSSYGWMLILFDQHLPISLTFQLSLTTLFLSSTSFFFNWSIIDLQYILVSSVQQSDLVF